MRKEPFKHLVPGKRYTIAKAFMDYDGKAYQPGRVYTFLGSEFLPHEDGLTLRFKQAGEAAAIRLQWREEAQMEIIESLEDYFVLTVQQVNTNMTFTPEDFDAHFDQWKDWPGTPWNRLLYSTCHRNLERYLRKPPLRILDTGGGNGEDTFFLVQLGHSVTLQDFSGEMLGDARQRAAEGDLLDQITFCQADVAELPNLFSAEEFDTILCHNMIKFVADGYALLDELYTLLKPDGLLSITAVNPHSEAYRQATFLNDLPAALAAIGQEQHLHPWFGKSEKRHIPEDLITYLEKLGCTLLGHFGLRNIVDYLTDNPSKFDQGYFAELEKLEYAMTDRYPYYLLARMFQIIVQK